MNGKDEENTEEEKNGYVVFKWNIHGSAGKKGVNKGGGGTLIRLPPLLSPAGFWTDDVNGFSSTSNLLHEKKF